MPPESETPAPQPAKPPETTEPEMHWIFAAIARRWPAVKNFIVHFAFLVIGVLAIMFLYEKFIIPGKDAELGQKDETIRTISEERDAANRENEKLRNEVAQYQASHDEKSFPLKKRVQIIVKQINEFADAVEKGTIDQNQKFNEWNTRFTPRINVLIGQLDEQGQHSEVLEKPLDYNRFTNQFPSYIRELKATAPEPSGVSRWTAEGTGRGIS